MSITAVFVGGPINGRRMFVSDDAPGVIYAEKNSSNLPLPFVRDAETRGIAESVKIERHAYRRDSPVVCRQSQRVLVWLYAHDTIDDPLLHIIGNYPGEDTHDAG